MAELVALLLRVEPLQVAVVVSVALGTAAIALICLSVLTPSAWRRRSKRRKRRKAAEARTEVVSADPASNSMTIPETLSAAREIEHLRLAGKHAPTPIWRRDLVGQVTWANRAYLDLVDKIRPEQAGVWPIPDLFGELIPVSLPSPPSRRRGSLETANGMRRWFELSTEVLDDGLILSATPIDGTVEAEEALRSFLQTLTGTFAQLSTGLAIFDKRRQMVMFNPAFVDLTRLEPGWLTTRPGLSTVFDRLRDMNMLPEPRDYKDWRDRLGAVENVPTQGMFEETWSLPGGEVYRVNARPHHDGGIALLIENISVEMGQTRRFRSELEMCQSVIDALGDSIVVFSNTGHQLMSNRAYRDMWNIADEDEAGDVPSILDASRHWQRLGQPAPLWGEIRDFVNTANRRTEWSDNARLRDGTGLSCRVIPLAGGATLIAFERAEPLPVFRRHHQLTVLAS